jgi:hypothetical protein
MVESAAPTTTVPSIVIMNWQYSAISDADKHEEPPNNLDHDKNNSGSSSSGSGDSTGSSSGSSIGGGQDHFPPSQTIDVKQLVGEPNAVHQLQDVPNDNIIYYYYYQQQGQLPPNAHQQQPPQNMLIADHHHGGNDEQQQQQQQHHIYCPVPNNTFGRKNESQEHVIMFDTNLIEEFGIETPKYKNLQTD